MNSVTQTLESNIISLCGNFALMINEVNDLNDYYFNSTASSLINSVSGNTTAVTVSSSLEKQEFVNGMTLVQNLVDFFGNAAVTTSNYLSTCDNLINGSVTASSVLSQDVENIGSRLKTLGQNLIVYWKTATNINKLYNSSGLSGFLSSLSDYIVVYGCSTTQNRFLSGVVLVEQFLNLMNNSAVTTDDYYSTVSQWVNGA